MSLSENRCTLFRDMHKLRHVGRRRFLFRSGATFGSSRRALRNRAYRHCWLLAPDPRFARRREMARLLDGAAWKSPRARGMSVVRRDLRAFGISTEGGLVVSRRSRRMRTIPRAMGYGLLRGPLEAVPLVASTGGCRRDCAPLHLNGAGASLHQDLRDLGRRVDWGLVSGSRHPAIAPAPRLEDV
jgi:hypothetical protein